MFTDQWLKLKTLRHLTICTWAAVDGEGRKGRQGLCCSSYYLVIEWLSNLWKLFESLRSIYFQHTGSFEKKILILTFSAPLGEAPKTSWRKEGELSPRQEVTRCSGESTAMQLLVLETWDGKARVDQICSLKEKMLARDIKRYSPLGLNQNKLSIQQDITSSAIVRVSKLRREIWRNEVSEAMSKLKRG